MQEVKYPPYSVLMSLYMKEKPEYLIQAIDSMINQNIRPDEIVIVKDGPLTTDLEAVLDNYKNEYRELFTIIGYGENKGLGYALNYGLEHCKNELVARMDTDDISKPNRCEKQLEVFELNSELVLLGSSIDEFIDDPSNVISRRVVPCDQKSIYEWSKRRSAFNHPTVMYKKSKVLEIGGYNSNLRRNQDVDLFGRMLFHGYEAANIEESLLFFRSDVALAQRRKSWENSKSYIQTIKEFWKMGFASYGDYLKVKFVQTIVFIMPVKLQQWVYKTFLRK